MARSLKPEAVWAAVERGDAGVAFAASIAAFPVDSDFRPNAFWQWGLYGAIVVPADAVLCIRAVGMAARSYRDAWKLAMGEADRAVNGRPRGHSGRPS